MKYYRPYQDRMLFDRHCLMVRNIPFELFVFWRAFKLDEFEGMTHEEFYANELFRFDHEFQFMSTQIDHWNLDYILFQPISSECLRLYIMNMLGRESFDFIPLIHPRGYRQNMFMDYLNRYGKGHTAIYLSSP